MRADPGSALRVVLVANLIEPLPVEVSKLRQGESEKARDHPQNIVPDCLVCKARSFASGWCGGAAVIWVTPYLNRVPWGPLD